MPDEQPIQPVSFDQQRFDALFQVMFGSYRGFIDDRSKVLEKGMDVNKQMAEFYERLLLLNTGIIGVSVSAVVSLAGREAATLRNVIFSVLVASAWIALIWSTLLCKQIMLQCLKSNRRMYTDWSEFAEKMNGLLMSTSTARLATTINGSIEVDGKDVPASVNITRLAEQIEKAFELDRVEGIYRANKSAEQSIPKTAFAVNLAQLGVILLGLAAIILLAYSSRTR